MSAGSVLCGQQLQGPLPLTPILGTSRCLNTSESIYTGTPRTPSMRC
jgi:hypothetical protein